MSDVWDKTTPLGTEAVSLGDDRIREMKSALETALGYESIFPGASPSTAPIFIPGFLRDSTANRPTGDALAAKRFFCNTTLNVLERYNGSSWDPVATLIPAGTKMLFYQAAAPTGWTAVAVNDKFLRVVSAGGSGGSTGGSGLTPSSSVTLAHSHTVSGHTHSISSAGAHTHTTPDHTHTLVRGSNTGIAGGTPTSQPVNMASAGGALDATTWGGGGTHTANPASGTTNSGEGGSNTGSDGAHDHGGATGSASPGTNSQLSNTAFQYADVIVATKD